MTSRSSSGRWCAGNEKFGVRWKTVSSLACCAMTGMDWTPLEPVPITPTRMPVKSTPSWGQRFVWWIGPRKSSAPGISGALGNDRHPVAMIRNRASMVSPVSVPTVQRCASSSYVAAVTRVSNVMSRRRS